MLWKPIWQQIKKDNRGFRFVLFWVTRPGFEPRQAESESAVLPLYDQAMLNCCKTKKNNLNFPVELSKNREKSNHHLGFSHYCISVLYTTPSFITNFTCFVTSMFAIGSPATPIISASIPACNLPILSPIPKTLAFTEVAD